MAGNQDRNATQSSAIPSTVGNPKRTASLETDFNREYMRNFFPSVCRQKKWFVKQFVGNWSKEKEARIRVEFGSNSKSASQTIYMDFFLTMQDQGRWKIFKIGIAQRNDIFPY